MPLLGVLGWPVAHSRSPAIHNAALAELGLAGWHYQLLPVPPALFPETARALGDAGFAGANVTIPHKEAALALADEASDTARAIGAANTLTFRPGGTVAAENTDAPGLLAALGVAVAGMRAQVLGAGGSARAAVWALLDAGAAEVLVWNRTSERARALAEDLGASAVERPRAADLLVNCTSVGLAVERSSAEDPDLNQLGLSHDQIGEYSYVADLVYRSQPTPLLAAAEARGAHTIDGLDILVAQGALSLRLWTDREPPVEVMRAAARQAGDGERPDAGNGGPPV
jgi:shikimate dehydrogenase